jgi:hypothetical protein
MILKAFNKGDKAERLHILKSSRKELIREKKAIRKRCDSFEPHVVTKAFAQKGIIPQVESMNLTDSQVLVIGNSVNFFDSHHDVSGVGSLNKSMTDKQGLLPMLKDHNTTVDSIFANNISSGVMDFPIKALGYNSVGSTQVAYMVIDNIEKAMFEKYQKGQIKQHSFALRYVDIELGVNDKEDSEGYEIWQKYANNIINFDEAEKIGYFWYIKQQEVFEFSSVVFGSNPYTPAFTKNYLELQTQKSLSNEPSEKDTQKKEPIGNEFLRHLIY